MQLETSSQTDEDFSKARTKAFFNELQHILNPDEAKLISLNDVKNLIKPNAETYVGMKTIPIAKIIGSEGRYQDFDNRFFPKNSFIKTRWELIDDAAIKQVDLPPIKVYEIAGLYFVRDGNHRVSVSKARGVEFIDAEIVSLQSEIKLKDPENINDMIRQIIDFEKKNFYAETNFGDITDYWDLEFTQPGQYDLIYNHILTHKYYINQNLHEEISMEDAILSWFRLVYLPVVHYMEEKKVMRHFKKKTVGDLYVYVIKYWDQLKAKYGENFPLDEAVDTFDKTHKVTLSKIVKNNVEKVVLRKPVTDSLD